MTGFHDIKGRKPLKNQLKKLIDKGRISHGYIFEGPKGSGKKLIADAFAELLFAIIKKVWKRVKRAKAVQDIRKNMF